MQKHRFSADQPDTAINRLLSDTGFASRRRRNAAYSGICRLTHQKSGCLCQLWLQTTRCPGRHPIIETVGSKESDHETPEVENRHNQRG